MIKKGKLQSEGGTSLLFTFRPFTFSRFVA